MINSSASRPLDWTNNGFASPIFRSKPLLLELFFNPVDVRRRKIDLVDRDHNRHMRRGLGVIDRFNCLRHDAVISGNDEHDDIGYISAARAHGGEGCVTGRVYERESRAVVIYGVGADVLGDATGFTSCYARLANRIQ